MKIGTRRSPLAVIQTEAVIRELKKKFPDEIFEMVKISTKGDEQLNKSLSSFGGKGVFTEELEKRLLSGEIDMAVHSAKDLPTDMPDGLIISAVLKRGAHEDCIIGNYKNPKIIGTGSARRSMQVKKLYPDAQIKDIRGNIQTRIDKMKSGMYDAVIMAKAAICRLNIDIDYRELPIVSAAGQGILAVESVGKNKYTEAINDIDTFKALEAERAFLRTVGGGCHAAVGAYAYIEDGYINISAVIEKNGVLFEKTNKGTDAVRTAEELAKWYI